MAMTKHLVFFGNSLAKNTQTPGLVLVAFMVMQQTSNMKSLAI